MFLTCPSPEQLNFPPHVDSEPCSPCYTSRSWEGQKTQSVIRWKDRRVSSCHLIHAAETCFSFSTSWARVSAAERLAGQGKELSSSVLSSPSPCASLSTTTTTEGPFILLVTPTTIWSQCAFFHTPQQTGSLAEPEPPASHFRAWKPVMWLCFSCCPGLKDHLWCSAHT